MIKKYSAVLFFLFALLNVYSNKKILFFNFESKNNKELSTKITKIVIENIFSDYNYEVLTTSEKDASKNKYLFKQGRNKDADYVITGTVNLYKDKITVNIKCLDISTKKTYMEIKEITNEDNKLEQELKLLLKDIGILEETNYVRVFKKGYEISIGGGITPFWSGVKLCQNNQYDFKYSIGHFKWGIIIPFSFSYYINPEFSTGFTAKLGYSFGFYWQRDQDYEFSNSILFNMLMKHKFGNVNNKFKFILEYGFSFNIDIPFNNITMINSKNIRNLPTPSLYINSGIYTFMGFEYMKNKFSFETGIFTESILLEGQLLNNNTFEAYETNYTVMLGLEMKFYFNIKKYYYKPIKISKNSKVINESENINEKEDKTIKINKEIIQEKDKIPNDKITQLEEAKHGDIILFENIYFYPDSDEIIIESYGILNKIAEVLKKRKDIKIEIRGYTNYVGKPKDEIELSKKRAQKVKEYLLKQQINGSRMKCYGYGGMYSYKKNIDKKHRYVEIKVSTSDLF